MQARSYKQQRQYNQKMSENHQKGFIFTDKQKLYRRYKWGLAFYLTGLWIIGVFHQLSHPIEGRIYSGEWYCLNSN